MDISLESLVGLVIDWVINKLYWIDVGVYRVVMVWFFGIFFIKILILVRRGLGFFLEYFCVDLKFLVG